MPANASGWFWHCLARETGRIGHLHSPGHERGPWPWLPYALDNGCFRLWNSEANTFDEQGWLSTGLSDWRRLLFWSAAAPIKPMWGIVPDRPGCWEDTEKKWSIYAPELAAEGIALAVAVQDGASPALVRALSPAPHVIAVGGSTDWKWNTVEMWLREFPRVHVLRCNSPAQLPRLESLGAMSCDGTGWNRGDRTQTRGLEEWAHSKSTPANVPLWPHASRARNRRQASFA
jgi:hypothetical protein